MLKNICKSGGMLEELLVMDPVYMDLIGSDGEDDESEDDNQNDDDDAGSDDDDEGSEDEDGEDDDDETEEVKSLKATIANFDQERDRWRNKISKANKERDALQVELDKVKKDGTSDEATKTEISTVKKTNEKLEADIHSLRLENAFLKDNTHAWVDPAAALRLADLSDVEIDDDGSVHGLKAALDKLAANSSYLIKTDGQDKGGKKPGTKPSGDKPGERRRTGGDAKSKAAEEARLRNKFPGLRR